MVLPYVIYLTASNRVGRAAQKRLANNGELIPSQLQSRSGGCIRGRRKVLSHEVPADGRQREGERERAREREGKVQKEAAGAELRIGHNNFPRNLFERHNIIFYTRQSRWQGVQEGRGRGKHTHTHTATRAYAKLELNSLPLNNLSAHMCTKKATYPRARACRE